MNLRPTIHPNCPESLKQIIVQCWNQEPTNRPSSSVVIEEIERVQEEYEQNKDAWDALLN